MSPPPAILVRSLRKRYNGVEAVCGIDFDVGPGEVFGLLGRNGAGKTTTVEILEGLRARSSGEVAVLGFDPGVQPHALKDRIGVCLQATNLPEKIKVGEAVRLFGSFYSRSVSGDALLDRLQLSEKRDVYYSRLSGGQKQRLAVALALVNDPQVLFLDEPTAGLDPQARLEIRNLVEELRCERRTILLTTHYIEEAERLCDRVAIIDEGRIIAIGPPREIQSRTAGRSIIEIECDQPLNGDVPCSTGGDTISFSENRCSLAVASREPARALVELVKWIDQQGAGLSDIHLKRPTLEDVFIELTGKSLGE